MVTECGMGYVYILSSYNRQAIYVGVTNDLMRRLWEHKNGYNDGFTKRYRIDRLVYFAEYASITDAIAREKQLKGWTRKRKDALIESMNPEWKDLSSGWWE